MIEPRFCKECGDELADGEDIFCDNCAFDEDGDDEFEDEEEDE